MHIYVCILTLLEEDDEDFLFDQPETDEAREKFEVIGIKMDLHKNGILYLKELVN